MGTDDFSLAAYWPKADHSDGAERRHVALWPMDLITTQFQTSEGRPRAIVDTSGSRDQLAFHDDSACLPQSHCKFCTPALWFCSYG